MARALLSGGPPKGDDPGRAASSTLCSRNQVTHIYLHLWLQVGHLKTVIILAGGFLLFHEAMPLKKLAGIVLGMSGIVWCATLACSSWLCLHLCKIGVLLARKHVSHPVWTHSWYLYCSRSVQGTVFTCP